MNLGVLAASAEKVAEFGGLRTGIGTPAGLTVYWDARNQQWLADLWPIAKGVARLGALRGFARGILAAVESRDGEHEYLMFDDGYTSVEASVGFDDEGLYFSVWAWFDTKQDFVGVSASGEPLYHNQIGGPYVELHGEALNEQAFVAAATTLLTRLDATSANANGGEQPRPRTVATFSRPGKSSALARLVLSRRPQDGQWLVTLHPALVLPATAEAVRSLAETIEQVVTERNGSRSTSLIVSDRYRLDVLVGFDSARNTYFVQAGVRSPGENGEEHVLGLDARFEALREPQLRTVATDLRHA